MERFIPTAEEDGVYRLPEGTGNSVGVCGREVMDADEVPPPDILDCGLRKPVLIANGLTSPVLSEGDNGRLAEEAEGRKEVGAVGIDNLRFSLIFFVSLSFWGEGESSMMRTHPEESPLSFLACVSELLSLLLRESTLFLCDSQLVLAVDALDVAEDAELVTITGEPWRPVMLAMRNLGTRV